MFLFDVLHLLNEFHVFTSPIKKFTSIGVIFILSEVLCWPVARNEKCNCYFQPSWNLIKKQQTSNKTTKFWWNQYYIYFSKKNSNESYSTSYKQVQCHFGPPIRVVNLRKSSEKLPKTVAQSGKGKLTHN